jgi:hypothetical protein
MTQPMLQVRGFMRGTRTCLFSMVLIFDVHEGKWSR